MIYIVTVFMVIMKGGSRFSNITEEVKRKHVTLIIINLHLKTITTRFSGRQNYHGFKCCPINYSNVILCLLLVILHIIYKLITEIHLILYFMVNLININQESKCRQLTD